ncbi:MAG TPA: arginine deiminase family protein, partial [Thermoanaerobaculia bacterium]|nr:arginine deiminase family protein [Thermoanaerobaculia bacterium]
FSSDGEGAFALVAFLHGARAREEHRLFQQVLRLFAEVLEIQDLLEEVLADADRKAQVLADLDAALRLGPAVTDRLAALTPERLAAALVEGIEQPHPEITGSIDSLFLLPPISNYYFQRDPVIPVGDRLVRGSMATPGRLREPLVSGAVFEHHPPFARPDGAFWFHEFRAALGKNVSYARMRPHIEGGDVLVLREDLLAIGYSERTEETTIERLSEALKKAGSTVRHIVVVALPHERSCMHLDTVFTQVSEGECLCYSPMILAGGAEEADVYSVDLTHDEITWTPEHDFLSALKRRGLDLEPIPCGGRDPIDEQREQWTDGANAFAVAPGVIVCYDRNERTAEELDRHGYEIVRDEDLLLGRREIDPNGTKKVAIQLSTTELARARGGPRCMTMPLVRERLG